MDADDFRSRYARYLTESAAWTEARLRNGATGVPAALAEARGSLLELFPEGRERRIASKALANPYFPATLLWLAWLENGYRFKYPARPELAPQQVIVEKGLRNLILLEEFKEYQPGRVLSVPLGETPDPSALPANQWCDYCGLCCASFGGVAPMAPKEATYPAHWLDDLWLYQFWCPFLFEYHWTGRLFCSIHAIKPIWCSEFADEKICRRVKQGFGR
jgi:hypothetical protein